MPEPSHSSDRLRSLDSTELNESAAMQRLGLIAICAVLVGIVAIGVLFYVAVAPPAAAPQVVDDKALEQIVFAATRDRGVPFAITEREVRIVVVTAPMQSSAPLSAGSGLSLSGGHAGTHPSGTSSGGTSPTAGGTSTSPSSTGTTATAPSVPTAKGAVSGLVTRTDDKMVQSLTDLLAKRPDLAPARAQLVEIYIARKQKDQAVQASQQGIDASKSDGDKAQFQSLLDKARSMSSQ